MSVEASSSTVNMLSADPAPSTLASAAASEMSETVSVASLRVQVPARWVDMSSSLATEEYPVVYADPNSTPRTVLRFSPNYHKAATLSDAIAELESPVANGIATPAPSPAPAITNSATYPGAVSANTVDELYTGSTGTQMIAHWWLLQEATSGTVYAVRFTGESSDTTRELIDAIDASIQLDESSGS